MPDYKTMYFKLFAAMADAMEIMDKAQKETEEMYINAPDFEFKLPNLEIVKKENE